MSQFRRFAAACFFALSLDGLILSVIANVLSYLPYSPPGYLAFYWLQLGIFLLIIPHYSICYADPEVVRLRQGRWFISRGSKLAQEIDAAINKYAPRWAHLVSRMLTVYFVVLFIWLLITFRDSHDLVPLELLRTMSAFWMLCYSIFWVAAYSQLRRMFLPPQSEVD